MTKEKKCSKCGKIFPNTIEYFYKYRQDKTWLMGVCKNCKKDVKINKDVRNKWKQSKIKSGLCCSCLKNPITEGKTCQSCLDYQRNRNRDLKRKAVAYLGGACSKCGIKDKIEAIYDFHHPNLHEKEFQLSKILRLSWDKVKKELDKCNLVCSNCHRKIHYKED